MPFRRPAAPECTITYDRILPHRLRREFAGASAPSAFTAPAALPLPSSARRVRAIAITCPSRTIVLFSPSDVDFAADFAITSASNGLGLARPSCREYDFRAVKFGVRVVVWKLYVEHAVKPPVQFYETKPHPNKASALKRALAIYRNPGWDLHVLFIEGTNGERMEASEIKTWCERAAAAEQ